MEYFIFFRNLAIFMAAIMLVKYAVYLFCAPFYDMKEAMRRLYILRLLNKERGQRRNPRVSVIIPAWNEEVGIISTIRSILHSNYENYEVIVVNDGSTDRTAEQVESFKASLKEGGDSILLINRENGGKGKALNTGIENASGDIILTVDGDSAMAPDSIGNLVRYFDDERISAVVGNVKVANSWKFITLLQKIEYLFGFYYKRAHAVMGAEYIFGGACAAFRKRVFETYGLFDEHNKTEDIEMSMRLRFHGERCTYAEDVVCYTEGASTIKGLIDQRLRWKKGRFDTFIKYRTLFFSLNKKHNPFLSWFVLPYALLAEIQLLFEPLFYSLLVTYSIITGDYLSLAFGLLFIFLVYFFVGFFSYSKENLLLILAFPITWAWFYVLVWIEYLALLKSVTLLWHGRNIRWQEWDRQGIHK